MNTYLTNYVSKRMRDAAVYVLGHMPIDLTSDQIYEDFIGDERVSNAFANAVSMVGTEDPSFWSNKAGSYLRSLFHAAALADGCSRQPVWRPAPEDRVSHSAFFWRGEDVNAPSRYLSSLACAAGTRTGTSPQTRKP